MPTVVPVVILIELKDKPVAGLRFRLILRSVLGFTLGWNELKGREEVFDDFYLLASDGARDHTLLPESLHKDVPSAEHDHQVQGVHVTIKCRPVVAM